MPAFCALRDINVLLNQIDTRSTLSSSPSRRAHLSMALAVTTRFVFDRTVVRSTQPERVAAASQRVGELVAAGVVLSSGGEYGPGGPTYVFTKLNELKPPMIAEATARAREAAEQFARDARSELGGIRRANQGIFEILPRDQAPGIFEGNQILKTVRVVSTIEYVLD